MEGQKLQETLSGNTRGGQAPARRGTMHFIDDKFLSIENDQILSTLDSVQ